jgi:hypothetical protein
VLEARRISEVAMYLRFSFEDGAETLEFMPLSMRRKLDLAGVKINLAGWQALTLAERLALAHFPVESPEERDAFVEVLRGFCGRAGVKVEPLPGGPLDGSGWSGQRVPDAVRARRDIPLGRWSALTDEERYVLLRLAEKQRGAERFDAAVQSLRL